MSTNDEIRWAVLRKVACPRCGAQLNEACHTRSGKTHPERNALARGINPKDIYTVRQLSAFARGEYTPEEAVVATKHLATQLLAARRARPIP